MGTGFLKDTNQTDRMNTVGESFYNFDNAKVFITFNKSKNTCRIVEIEGELSYLYIPRYVDDFLVDSIDVESLFESNKTLHAFMVSSENEYFSTVDGVLFNRDGSILIAYPPKKDSKIYHVPCGVKTIGEAAMMFNQNLEIVYLGQDVTCIKSNAISCCRQIKEVHLFKPLNEICMSAFKWLDTITDVYYSGNTTDWWNVRVADDNSCLIIADMHFDELSDGKRDCFQEGIIDEGSNHLSRINRILVRAHIMNSFIKLYCINRNELDKKTNDFADYLTKYEKYLLSTEYLNVRNENSFAEYIHQYASVCALLWCVGINDSPFSLLKDGMYNDFGEFERIEDYDSLKKVSSNCVMKSAEELINMECLAQRLYRNVKGDFDCTVDKCELNSADGCVEFNAKNGGILLFGKNIREYKNKYSLLVSTKMIFYALNWANNS